MVIPQKFECELCGKAFEKALDVRDEIAVMNGENTRCYAYVCSACIKDFVEAMDDLFPKSKYAVRRKEAERIAANARRQSVVC